MNCKFEDICDSGNNGCDFCSHNPEACTQDFFSWNGEGEEPTQDELDNEIY